MMRRFLLWADVPLASRKTWRTEPGPCAAAVPSWHGDKYAPCYGYVKPGRQFCWQHDPEIQTPERQAATAQAVAAGRRRRQSDPGQVSGWVGELEYS